MNHTFALGLLTLALVSFSQAKADTINTPSQSRAEEEVAIQRVFFPADGFDDNDNVQIRIEGELPDPCYVLGGHTVTRDAGSAQTLVVHQFAWRRTTGICDTGGLSEKSTFSEDVSLGRLDAGTYQIGYQEKGLKLKLKPIHVAVAGVATLDELNYANVSNVSVPEIILFGTRVNVTLSGRISSWCDSLKESTDVQWQGDVVVIRPIEIQAENCIGPIRPFEKIVDLGILPPGEYLIHVRSRGGKAVQRTVWVFRSGV